MLLNNIENLTSFGYSILTGILAGFIYDLFRAFRYTKKPKKKLKYIEDLVFWFIITILFFVITVKVTDGILRGFLFIGFFSGGGLYFLVGSKHIFSIFLKIFKLIIQLINEIIRLIKIPFTKLKIKKRIKKILLMRKEMKAERKKLWRSIRGRK